MLLILLVEINVTGRLRLVAEHEFMIIRMGYDSGRHTGSRIMMTGNEQPVLRSKISGRRVKSGRVAVVRGRAAQRVGAARLAPAIADAAENSFHNGLSLSRLAETQKVKPLTDPSVLAGAIPSSQDVDEFLSAIYGARRQER
jgi:hypothetical protein